MMLHTSRDISRSEGSCCDNSSSSDYRDDMQSQCSGSSCSSASVSSYDSMGSLDSVTISSGCSHSSHRSTLSRHLSRNRGNSRRRQSSLASRASYTSGISHRRKRCPPTIHENEEGWSSYPHPDCDCRDCDQIHLCNASLYRNKRQLSALISVMAFLSAALMLASSGTSNKSSSSPIYRPNSRSLFSRNRHLMVMTPEMINEYPFSGLADVTDPFHLHDKTETGLYWQIPRSGGTTLKLIMGSCLDRVQASRVARDHCDVTDPNAHVCQTTFGRYVNADPSDDAGIERAKQLHVVESGLADVLVSSRLHHVSELFDKEQHSGRAFTVLRHPVERTASTFYYLQNAEWERQYSPELKTMSIVEYAGLESTANDWMVRWLTGKNAEVLDRQDLEFAKELLRRKFLILLTEEMKTSVHRLADYMGWSVTDEMEQCVTEHSTKGQNANAHNRIEPGTPEYEALWSINQLDIELYEYAQELFVEQWGTVQIRAEEHAKHGRGSRHQKQSSNIASSSQQDQTREKPLFHRLFGTPKKSKSDDTTAETNTVVEANVSSITEVIAVESANADNAAETVKTDQQPIAMITTKLAMDRRLNFPSIQGKAFTSDGEAAEVPSEASPSTAESQSLTPDTSSSRRLRSVEAQGPQIGTLLQMKQKAKAALESHIHRRLALAASA